MKQKYTPKQLKFAGIFIGIHVAVVSLLLKLATTVAEQGAGL